MALSPTARALHALRWPPLLLIVALLWLQVGFLREFARARRASNIDSTTYHSPGRWTLTSRPAHRLEAFLKRAGEVVPPGSRALFRSASTSQDRRQALERFDWAVLLAPEIDLVPPDHADEVVYDHLVVYGEHLDRSGFEQLLELPEGGVYRLP